MAEARPRLGKRMTRWGLMVIGAVALASVGLNDVVPVVAATNELTSMCVNKASARLRWVSSPGGCNTKTETALSLPGGAPVYLCVYPPDSFTRRVLSPGACAPGETPLTLPASGPSYFCYSASGGYFLKLVASPASCAPGETAVAVSVPVAVPDTYAPLEDVSTTVPAATGVLANDTDAHLDGLTAQFGTNPAHALTFVLNADGSFTYKSSADYCGSDSFMYTATDGAYTSAPAMVTLNVTCVNDAPTYTKGPNQVVFDNAGPQTVAGWASGMSPGPANESGQTLTFNVTGNTLPGVLSVAPVVNPSTGTLTYTPAPGQSGTTTITLELKDNGGILNGGVDASSQMFTITVNLSNQAPVANNDGPYTVIEDTPFSSSPASVLTNDTDPDAGDTITAVLPIGPSHAASFSLNANGTFSYTPVLNYCGSDSFTYRAQDNHGANSVAAATVSITVSCVNDAPVNIMPSSPSTNEDTTLTLSGAGAIQVSDVDAAPNPVRVTLTASFGTMTLDGTTGLSFTVGDGTADATMTFTGTIVDINAALDGMTFIPTPNYSGASAAGITITTNDQGFTGSGGAMADTDFLTIVVNAVNDAPVNVVPGPQTVNEDTDLTFTGGTAISVNDVDAGVAAIKVSLNATNGTVTLSGVGGLTFVDGTANGQAMVHFTGTLANVNAAMSGMKFRGALNFSGGASLQIVTDDQGNTGSGGPLTDTDSVAITVNAVNDAPVNAMPAPPSVNEDAVLTLSGVGAIQISDVDAGALAVQVTLTAGNATMTLDGIAGLAFTVGDGTADATMTFTGTIADVNAALDGMTFTPTGNFAGMASISITTNDQGNTGSGGAMSDTDVRMITVNPVNDAPMNTVPGAQMVDEDTDLVFTGGSAISVTDIDAGAGAIKVSLNATNGTVTLSGVGGLTFVDGTANGQAMVHFTGTLTNVNAAMSGMKFRGTLNFNGAASLQIISDDQGNTGSGGALTDTDSVAITVNPVNDAPVGVANQSHAVTGNVSINVPAGSGLLVGVTDIEMDSFAAQIVGAAPTGSTLTINTDGSYFYNPAPGHTGTDVATFKVCDTGVPVACSADHTLTLTTSDMIWFIDNNAGAAGDGRLSAPFNTLGGFQAVNNGSGNNPATNDNIFIDRNVATDYVGPVTLLNGQRLLGKGATATIVTMTGISLAPHSATLPTTSGTAPTIVTTTGTLNAVNLNSAGAAATNTIRGIRIMDTTGVGLAGSGFGTLTVTETSIGPSRAGRALSLSTGTLSSSTLDTVSSSNGATPVSLTSVGGILTVSAGSIAGYTAGGVSIAGGTLSATWTGTIGSGTGTAVSVATETSGTINFAGAVTQGSSGKGVELLNNTGATTVNFSGGVNVSSATNNAFSATGGGTVSVTGVNNNLTTTTATALNVSNTTIGANGIRFLSINAGTAGSGPTNGIVLNTTGSSGGMTVTGTGSAGTGGTIQKTSGDGISLTSTASPSLSWMTVQNNLGNGILGSNVTNFTLDQSTVSGNGDNDVADEGGLHFDNLLGTVNILNTTVFGNFEDNARIINTSGTLSQLNVTSSTFRDNSTVSPGNTGLQVIANGTANITVDIIRSSFLRNRSRGVQFITNDSGSINVDVGDGTAPDGNTFTDDNIAVDFAHNSSGTFTFNAKSNTFAATTTLNASPINVNKGSLGGTMSGTISGNSINNNGSLTGPGIEIKGNGNTGSLTIKVDSNNVTGVQNFGIHVIARDGNTPGNTVNATITNNTVTLTGAGATEAIRVDAGVTATDTPTMCADIRGNTASTDPTTGLFAIRVRNRFGSTYKIEGLTPAPATNAQVATYLSGLNGGATTTADQVNSFQTIVACPEP